ncbi:hypothetical protein C1H46_010470 [Malus baccata]|uniref:Uncharacterized protein n=1 Tax=Malus baccata TaxID=106549 RepID=A0A540N0A0_MALBA|nr:hypothetical protein C1H46_010470 [Malus baccata]
MELSPVNMSWTNEKHVKFLNSMEESFVRAMLEKKKNNKDHRHPPRLDRYLPDTSDSTLDLKTSSRITKNRNSLQGTTCRTPPTQPWISKPAAESPKTVTPYKLGLIRFYCMHFPRGCI